MQTQINSISDLKKLPQFSTLDDVWSWSKIHRLSRLEEAIEKREEVDQSIRDQMRVISALNRQVSLAEGEFYAKADTCGPLTEEEETCWDILTQLHSDLIHRDTALLNIYRDRIDSRTPSSEMDSVIRELFLPPYRHLFEEK